MNPAYNDYIVFCHSYSLYQGESIAAFTNKDGMEILLLMNEEETLEKNKEALAKIRSNIEKTPLKEIKNYIYIRKKDENEKEMLKMVQSQLGIEDSNTILQDQAQRHHQSGSFAGRDRLAGGECGRRVCHFGTEAPRQPVHDRLDPAAVDDGDRPGGTWAVGHVRGQGLQQDVLWRDPGAVTAQPLWAVQCRKRRVCVFAGGPVDTRDR